MKLRWEKFGLLLGLGRPSFTPSKFSPASSGDCGLSASGDCGMEDSGDLGPCRDGLEEYSIVLSESLEAEGDRPLADMHTVLVIASTN